jgi:hypothetical protein
LASEKIAAATTNLLAQSNHMADEVQGHWIPTAAQIYGISEDELRKQLNNYS